MYFVLIYYRIKYKKKTDTVHGKCLLLFIFYPMLYRNILINSYVGHILFSICLKKWSDIEKVTSVKEADWIGRAKNKK